MSKTATEIAQWAEDKASVPKLHKGKGSHLTFDQLEMLALMARQARTQTDIAQAIGCDQATVCRYLQRLAPTGEYAGAFLRAAQGELAQDFVKKAKGSDILDLLERFESIPAKKDGGKAPLLVQIGIKAEDVTITLSPPSDAGQERNPPESLAIVHGSDKSGYVDQV